MTFLSVKCQLLCYIPFLRVAKLNRLADRLKSKHYFLRGDLWGDMRAVLGEFIDMLSFQAEVPDTDWLAFAAHT